jgi:protein-disulfide isomerase
MNHHTNHPFNKELWATPISILLGSLIISASIYMSPSRPTTSAISATSGEALPINIKPLQTVDHVLGNRNAKVVLVEYSDTECAYCKMHHATLHKIIATYGKDVAWVYRHNPLPNHPRAQKEAEATECAAELGGNEAFWKYIDEIFAITPSNNKLDPAELPKIAVRTGLNEKAFNDCLASGKHAQKIAAQQQEAIGAGQKGTPATIVLSKGGASAIRGAVPYERIESAIKEALAK